MTKVMIGNINQKLLDYDAPNFLCLEFEKIKSIYDSLNSQSIEM